MAKFVMLLGSDDIEVMVNPDLVGRVIAADDGQSRLIFGQNDYTIVMGAPTEVVQKLSA